MSEGTHEEGDEFVDDCEDEVGGESNGSKEKQVKKEPGFFEMVDKMIYFFRGLIRTLPKQTPMEQGRGSYGPGHAV